MANGSAGFLEARKKRWHDFMAMDGKKSCMFVVDCYEGMPSPPKLWPDKKRERVDWILKKYEYLSRQAQWLEDDMIPHLDMITGTEIFAEAFGCQVHRPSDGMPSARPLVHNAAEASRLKVPDLESSTLTLLFEIADEARSRAGSDAAAKLPDIQSPMDIAALIWDKNDFYVAMLEEPEAVKEVAGKVSALLTAFLDRWFARYGRDFVAHYPFYYMTSGITLSEDEVGIVNQAAFGEFFLPELCRLSARYGGLGMHCCASARHQWSNFKKIPGLRLLNLARPGNELNEAMEYFAGHVAQHHGEVFTEKLYFGGRPVWEWPRLMPENAHVVLNAVSETKAEALEICAKLNQACGRG